MIRRFYAGMALLVVSIIADAQIDNSFFNWTPVFDSADSGRLGIEVENLNYLRNVEYATFADKGRTLYGFQAAGQLHYQVSPNVAVRAGLFAMRDFGNDGFTDVLPLYGITWKKGFSTLHFGNLQGAVMHRLIQPLYDPDFIITRRIENGTQYIFENERLFFDLWLNWEKNIFWYSNNQEEFTGGVSTSYDLLKRKSFTFTGIVQMLARHKGGEINSFKASPSSRYNFNYGAGLAIPVKNFLKLNEIGFQAHFAYYEDPSKVQIDTFIDGLGQYFTMTLQWDRFTFMANYWDAHQFQSPSGDVIFQSISRKNPSLYSRHYRKLASAAVFYEVPLSSETHLLFRGILYRDLTWETWDYVTELYIRWNLFRKINGKKAS